MPKRKGKTANTLVGLTYFIDPSKSGEYNDGFKGGRPHYILRSVGHDDLLLVISTGRRTSNSINNKQYIEYEGKNISRAYLRMDLKNGYTIKSKEEIKNDAYNLKESIIISNKDREKLLNFYKSVNKETF